MSRGVSLVRGESGSSVCPAVGEREAPLDESEDSSTWWEGFVNQVRGFGFYSKCSGKPSERGMSQTDLLCLQCVKQVVVTS